MRIALDSSNGATPILNSPLPLTGQGDLASGASPAGAAVAVGGFAILTFSPHEAVVFQVALAMALERWFREFAPAGARPEPRRIIVPGAGPPGNPPTPRPGAG